MIDRLPPEPRRSSAHSSSSSPESRATLERVVDAAERRAAERPLFGPWRRGAERQALLAIVDELREIRQLLERMRMNQLGCDR